MTVPDGGTALIGSYSRVSEGRNEYGVPGLGKLPVVGRLYRNIGAGRQVQTIQASASVRIIDLAEDAGEAVLPGHTTLVRREGNRVTLAFDPRRVKTAELIAQVSAGNRIHDLFVQDPPIEEIIARLYTEARV